VTPGRLFDWSTLTPPAPLSVSEWAEAHRILSRVASGEPGPYQLSRTPFWREVMDVLSPVHPCSQVSLIKGAQIGASELGLTWLGFLMSAESGQAGPAMLVLPTIDLAHRFVKTRLDPMIADSPALLDRVRKGGAGAGSEQGSSLNLKLWPGGSLITVGASSGSALRSTPAKSIMVDEADAMPLQLQDEGDPLELLRARQRTFASRKMFVLSTPTVAGRSRIEREFLAGDQTDYYVHCPRCNAPQTIQFSRLQFNPSEPEAGAWLQCEQCEALIEESRKTSLLAEGVWVPRHPERSHFHRSFRLSSLYSPVGWSSWTDAAVRFVEARKRPETQRSFANTFLAEPYVEHQGGDSPPWEQLHASREDYTPGHMPAEALAMTAGVDVQKNRLEVFVAAWGERLEMWAVDFRVLPGDTSDLDSEGSPWRQLEALLASTYPVEGEDYEAPIVATGLDTGYATQQAYEWWHRQGRARNVHLLKGRERAPLLVSRPQTLTSSKVKSMQAVQLYTVSTHLAKLELYAHLALTIAEDGTKPTGLRHYPHAPWCDEGFFQQLTAEALQTEVNRAGYEKTRWVKLRDRNEVLDCHVYARVAAAIAQIDRVTDRQLSQAKLNRKRQAAGMQAPKRGGWKRLRK